MEASPQAVEQLNWDEIVGGREPTGTRLSVTGVRIEDGQKFKKGQIVEIRVIARVGDKGWSDKIDSATGEPVDCTEVYKARCQSARVERTLESVD
jgi:hypothetical protein